MDNITQLLQGILGGQGGGMPYQDNQFSQGGQSLPPGGGMTTDVAIEGPDPKRARLEQLLQMLMSGQEDEDMRQQVEQALSQMGTVPGRTEMQTEDVSIHGGPGGASDVLGDMQTIFSRLPTGIAGDPVAFGDTTAQQTARLGARTTRQGQMDERSRARAGLEEDYRGRLQQGLTKQAEGTLGVIKGMQERKLQQREAELQANTDAANQKWEREKFERDTQWDRQKTAITEKGKSERNEADIESRERLTLAKERATEEYRNGRLSQEEYKIRLTEIELEMDKAKARRESDPLYVGDSDVSVGGMGTSDNPWNADDLLGD